MALVILPILLPINRAGPDVPGVSGLDSLAWPNVATPEKNHRLWAHLVLAVLVVLWVCFNFYAALRRFVRLRQTILTMPEHRMRASATTILVQSIPRKWLNVPALDALYDVFPGGIKDIWINRNYDDLQEKVNKRTKIARALEAAETNLVIACTKKHMEMEAARLKKEGHKKKSRKQRRHDDSMHDARIASATHEDGVDAGNPHEIEQQLQQVLEEPASSSSSSSRSTSPNRKHGILPIQFVGQGIHAVGEGFRDVGQGVDRFNRKLFGGVKGAFVRDNKPAPAPQAATANYEGSPTSEHFNGRGTSSDTHTRLAGPDTEKEKFGSDGTVSNPNSPSAAQKELKEDPEEKEKAAKTTGFHPFKKLLASYLGQGDFASPQPYQKIGQAPILELKDSEKEKIKYDTTGLYDDAFAEDHENALWRTYLKSKDRETMRIPLFKQSWWPSIPLVGKNAEIADDQAHEERFPLMNSAFIQFNHQVAAHMACQSVSHHIPRQMAPRTVEVNPNYVLWDNLSMKWWERYLRMTGIILLIVGLIIFWGVPVAFTGTLSQIKTLTDQLHWLAWINDLPIWLVSFIQGVLPPLFLAILFAVLPILLRFLAGLTGTTTAGERELLVQNFYFGFVFVQLFLVVSISTGITSTISSIVNNPIGVPQILAEKLPKSANYFFSYMILQALSISSGTLLQIGAVIVIVFLRFMDTTPREKVSRVLSRPGINWGTMIPVYTNFGAIGIIYSVISPLILIMMVITFGLFWFTYRYQMIYVSYAKAETNGLIFPKAVNQLFTGLYFLELCLIGLFFLQGDKDCFPHAIIMIIMLGCTVLYQFVLNAAFGPLFTYLPITFEDEAVQRDEEFQRAQASRWEQDRSEHRPLTAEDNARTTAEERELAHLEEQDRKHGDSSHGAGAYELKNMNNLSTDTTATPNHSRRLSNWAQESRRSSNSRARSTSRTPKKHKRKDPLNFMTDALKQGLDDVARPIRDIENQVLPSANLFDSVDDELADIEPEARQKLIKRSFQHPSTRAIQPAVWIPHDELGVAKDEIQRTSAFTSRVWITSVNARLDARGNVMYKGLPPDRDPFENIEV
jgi:hypothetical protein